MRIKRGTTKKQKHKKVLKLAKGYRMSYSKLYRRAREAVLHAGNYSFAHRRRRRGQMRQDWIRTISAGLIDSGVSYSEFAGKLKKNNIEVDRKNLANMIMENKNHFDLLVAEVSK